MSARPTAPRHAPRIPHGHDRRRGTATVPAGRSGRVRHRAADGVRARSRGFTMIEVLIVVAIIGILAAIAYPSYGEYVRQTRRADAHLALLEQRQVFERCRALRYTYANCTLSTTTSPEGYYALSLSPAPTASAFTIVATATGAQSGDTECKKLTIDERERTLSYDASDASTGDCW